MMKFEDYIQSCSNWVRLYEKVWGYKCWGEDWVEKGLSEYRLPFWRKAEQIDRQWSSFEDFDEMGSSQMVEMCQMVMMAGVGMRMAARMLKAKEEDVATLHLETLFRYDLLAFLLDKQNPYTTLSWWRWIILYAPVMRELKKRGEKHIGFPAGLYKFLSGIEGWAGPLGILDEAILKKMDEFLKKVFLKKTAFTMLKNYECNFENLSLATKLTKDEIRSRAAVTLGERWNNDPFYALRDSLDGKLNIAPRAVADDVIDQLRKAYIREDRIKLHLTLPDEDDPDKEDPAIKIEAKAAKVHLQEESQDRQREKFADMQQEVINRWAAGSKKKKRFIRGLKDGHTLKLIAEELKIHPNTATNWKKELSARLREMLST